MLRLLLALICGLGIAVTLLLMRQQRVELQHECNQIHDGMLVAQTKLWRQQVQIAAAVAPGALKAVLADHELRVVPEGASTGTHWDEVMPRTDASSDWSILE